MLALSASAHAETVVETLTIDDFKVTLVNGNPSYTPANYTSTSTGITYAGNMAHATASNGDGFQFRTTNSNSGIVITANPKKAVFKSIKFTYAKGTNTMNVYGQTSALSEAKDLYDSSKQGTLIGSVSASGTVSTPANTEYKFIGFRSNSGALYLTSIEITYDIPTSAEPVAASAIKFNEEELTAESVFTVAPGEDLTFTSENALSMSVSVNEETANSAVGSITWTAPEINGEYTLSITAQGDEGTDPVTATIKVNVVATGDVTFDFAHKTYGMTILSGSDFNENPTTITNCSVSIIFDGGNNRLYNDGMRLYSGSHMTIIAPKGYIIDEIKLSTSINLALADGETGTFTNGIWAGEAKSVKICYTKTSGNTCVTSIDVSYAPASPALHIDGNALDATADGIDLEGATKKIHFEVAEGVSVWYKFVEATPATPAEVVRREAAADTDEDGFTLYTGSADNGIELSKAGTLHYYTAVNAIKGSVKTLTVNNTPTSIREITAEGAAAGAIYDLQGRKVVAPAKGIFIVNGKKVRL